MSTFFTNLVIVCMAIFAVTVIADAVISRSFKAMVFGLTLLVALTIMLRLTTGFPTPDDRAAFGGVSPLGALGLMFVCTILGILAHYFFYFRGKLEIRSILRPLFISPIVFLPLVGSVQGGSDLEPIQMVSFAILAFQNGFFWKVVLEHAKPKE